MSFYKYKSQCCGEGLKSLDLLLSNSKNYSSQLSLWFEDLRSQKWQWSIKGYSGSLEIIAHVTLC